MEADWEIEIGPNAPVIDACWAGFIDLRISPERAADFPETAAFPALADVLVRLNGPGSPVWTSKCDVWEPASFDPDELDAPEGTGNHAIACYFDLLRRSDQLWASPGQAIQCCEATCGRVRAHPMRSCRADLVIRRAFHTPALLALGITAYLTACGPTRDRAVETLAAALNILADCIHPAEHRTTDTSKLQ